MGGTSMIVIENLSKRVTENDVKYNYFYRLVKSEVSVLTNGEVTLVQAFGIAVRSD